MNNVSNKGLGLAEFYDINEGLEWNYLGLVDG